MIISDSIVSSQIYLMVNNFVQSGHELDTILQEVSCLKYETTCLQSFLKVIKDIKLFEAQTFGNEGKDKINENDYVKDENEFKFNLINYLLTINSYLFHFTYIRILKF